MRRDIPSWDDYFMQLAYTVATRSRDPNTQVGAVIVDVYNHIIATGYNGFLPGVSESEELWQRPHKYVRVIHAETNAIAHAAKKGHATDGCIIYVTAMPCINCMKLIAACGIAKVVTDKVLDGWDEDYIHTQQLCREFRLLVENLS